jgi:Ca2+-transporting ATPase
VFSDGLALRVLYQGVLISAITLSAYFIVDTWDSHEVAMTAAFLTLSMCEMFHSFTMRSLKGSIFKLHSHNIMLWGAMASSLVLTMLIIYVPTLAGMFALRALTVKELALSLGLSISIIPIVEVIKWVNGQISEKSK